MNERTTRALDDPSLSVFWRKSRKSNLTFAAAAAVVSQRVRLPIAVAIASPFARTRAAAAAARLAMLTGTRFLARLALPRYRKEATSGDPAKVGIIARGAVSQSVSQSVQSCEKTMDVL